MAETNTLRNEQQDNTESVKLRVESTPTNSNANTNNNNTSNTHTDKPESKPDKHDMGPQGTMMFDAKQVDHLIAGAIAKKQSNTAQLPALVGISEGFNGTKLILEGSKILVGRDKECDFVLLEPSVSATHSQIVKKEEGWKVMNMLSSNGTYVNDMKCHEAMLKPGDRIRFGRVEFLFSYISREELGSIDKPPHNNSSFWMGIAAAGLFFAIISAVLYWL